MERLGRLKERWMAHGSLPPEDIDWLISELEAALDRKPIKMVLHCPRCSRQHIDAPGPDWDNPPHRSHLCAYCNCVWRPADVPTEGVAEVETHGKADNWPEA